METMARLARQALVVSRVLAALPGRTGKTDATGFLARQEHRA